MSQTTTRYPAQAGKFYSDKKVELQKQIRACFQHSLGPNNQPRETHQRPIGLVVPHAGYMFSGPVAAHSYKRLGVSGPHESFVIFGPNHTGLGTGLSTMTRGEWRTPLGDARINTFLAETIVAKSALLDVEPDAHRFEHSIEVQLPFLQYLYNDSFSFVPICTMLQDLETSREIAQALVESVDGHDTILIASSDWTHYEPQQTAKMKDLSAIEAVLRMDEQEFQTRVLEKRISACGYGPVTIVISAAKKLGATRAELLSYQTSGDVTGEKDAVVGYAAIAFY